MSEKRTGSTFVQTALNSHPDITSYDELFLNPLRKERRDNTIFFLDVLSKKREKYGDDGYSLPVLVEEYLQKIYKSDKNVIFNLIYSQIEYWYKGNIDFTSILKRNEIRTIHLKRNFLDTVLSMKLKGLHRNNLLRKENNKIVLKPKKLEEEISNYKKRYNEWAKIFKPELSIDFEDVLTVKEKEEGGKKENYGMFNRISKTKTYMNPKMNKTLCEFFKVDNVPMYSYLTKFIDDKWQYVENADEVREFFNV